MQAVIVYYAKNVSRKYETEALLVYAEDCKHTGVAIAIICEVPKGVHNASIVHFTQHLGRTQSSGTIVVQYDMDIEATASYELDFDIDCSQTKLHMRKKRK